jgi:HAD superfamily hydrolase (TIGR01509 family)
VLRSVRAAGLATALVTTTPRALADIVLRSIRSALGEDPFDVTICGDEVPARKPDPAPYLQAMRALGIEPGECVVIEDSQAGISAGLAAGAAVLGVPAVQAVAPEPGLTLRDGLVGVGPAELSDVVAATGLVSAEV